MKRWLKRSGLALGILVALLGGVSAVMEARSPRMRPVDPTKRFEATPERVARGKYIAEAEAHCMMCHSEHDWGTHGAPDLPGLTGAGWNVPFTENHMPGRVFAPNITSDTGTGIGALPDDAIARAIREGVGHDGRALFMMPWRNFRGLSDEDLASLVVYLRTIPAVTKARETTRIDVPVRWFLKGEPEPLRTAVAQPVFSNPVERGRHLSDVGQCQLCHTPVDARHQPLPGMAFAGGQPFVIGGVRYLSANITPHASGIAHYDQELFIRTMRTGNIGGRRLSPVMPWRYVRQLTDGDLKALWAYLRTLPPVAHDVERTPVQVKANPDIDEHPAFASIGAPTPSPVSSASPP